MHKGFAGRTKSPVPLLLFAVLLIVGTILAGQEHDNQPFDLNRPDVPLTAEEKDRLVKRIANNNTDAILAAGDTHDRTFIPYLKRAQNSAAHDALAKIGDPEELRSIACYIADPKQDDFAMDGTLSKTLPYIGGWFSVGWYRLALDERLNRVYKRKNDYRLKHSPSTEDMATISPRAIALRALPKLFPLVAAQARVTSLDSEGQVKVWREWIDSHQENLQKMKPTGNGISYSGRACKESR